MNPTERLTSAECLSHPYFADLQQGKGSHASKSPQQASRPATPSSVSTLRLQSVAALPLPACLPNEQSMSKHRSEATTQKGPMAEQVSTTLAKSQNVSSGEHQTQPALQHSSSPLTIQLAPERGSVPAASSRSSQDIPAIIQRPEATEHASVVQHESIPEILPSRTSSKCRKAVPSTIPVERQSSNFPGTHGSHAMHAAPSILPHARSCRMLPRQHDTDVEMQASVRGDGSNDGIGYIDGAVPSSPAPSIDRLSACSSCGRGQRKVMALHASHAGMREGIGHHGSYSQPAFLGPAAHMIGAPVAREHLETHRSPSRGMDTRGISPVATPLPGFHPAAMAHGHLAKQRKQLRTPQKAMRLDSRPTTRERHIPQRPALPLPPPTSPGGLAQRWAFSDESTRAGSLSVSHPRFGNLKSEQKLRQPKSENAMRLPYSHQPASSAIGGVNKVARRRGHQ
eukprot:jgi/Ulvmu1/4473/UM002_0198.1